MVEINGNGKKYTWLKYTYMVKINMQEKETMSPIFLIN